MVPAVLAAQMSVGVMVGVMTLTGAMVVDHLHHQAHSVFPIMGVHVIGMYAFVIVVGGVVDRIGRTPSLAGGLLVMGLSVAGLLWAESVQATAEEAMSVYRSSRPTPARPEVGPERIVRAHGVDLCVQGFGDRADPAILLIAAPPGRCRTGTRSSASGSRPAPGS